jgi:hypothetical protein
MKGGENDDDSASDEMSATGVDVDNATIKTAAAASSDEISDATPLATTAVENTLIKDIKTAVDKLPIASGGRRRSSKRSKGKKSKKGGKKSKKRGKKSRRY